MAERVVSQPNSKIYGRLSIAIQARCNVEKFFDIKPNAFYPAPKVMSSIIKLTPKTPLEKQIDILSGEDIKRSNIFSRLFRSLNYLVWGDA